MSLRVTLHFGDQGIALEVRSISGVERLGEPARHELALFSAEPVAPSAVVGVACAILVESEIGARWIHGTVSRFVRIATTQAEPGRRYRAVVEATWGLARLGRASRVFQHVTVPDLVQQVLEHAGVPADQIEQHVGESHAEREYVVQWEEDDLRFIRRLCEEDGLWVRARAEDGGSKIRIEDTSSNAPTALDDALLATDASDLHHRGAVTMGGDPPYPPAQPAAWSPRRRAARRTGKVSVRDFDPQKPKLDLSASTEGGEPIEKATEIYLAPARFRTAAEGQTRARHLLEGLRADGQVLSFSTNAVQLAPGEAFAIENAPDYTGTPPVEGDWVAVAVRLSWTSEGASDGMQVEAIPKDVPFRLPRVTPRPRIHGVQSAFVTGPAGSEIHPDAAGRIFVSFSWDREGPTDDKSSLPVRAMQPNTPGSMVIPRVGWEVAVAFEDGDPDRPYVLGRVYNGKTPPPVALPANKTMTSIQSMSSPGGGGHNTITFDDASGRQHLSIHAAFSKTTTVANHMMVQTAKVEEHMIGGSRTVSVGADDEITVKQALISQVGSQTATVGGTQSIYVKGDLNAAVASESVTIGAALLEKVGNPVTGALNLGVSAALAGAGALGERLGPVGRALTTVGTTAAGIGWSMYQAATAPGAGPHAARDAGIRGLIDAAAGRVPGGDAIFASVTGGGRQLPWEAPPAGSGGAEAGGGAGGAVSDNAAAGGPGPGHRIDQVSGPYSEIIGGAHVVATPGSINWKTTGASMITVGGSHSTKTISYGAKVMGASEETLGSLVIDAKSTVGRDVKGAIATNVGGALSIKPGGSYNAKAGSKISIDVGGALTCDGGVVAFVVGSSVVAASSSGVLVKASTIKIQGATKQSGDTSQ